MYFVTKSGDIKEFCILKVNANIVDWMAGFATGLLFADFAFIFGTDVVVPQESDLLMLFRGDQFRLFSL